MAESATETEMALVAAPESVTIAYVHDGEYSPDGPETKGAGKAKITCEEVFSTAVNFVCVIMGSGIVGLPYAIAEMGWTGPAVMIIMACIMGYTSFKLVDTMARFPHVHDFAGLGTVTYGDKFGVMCVVLQLINNFGASILYVVLAGSNLHIITGVLSDSGWSIICAAVLLPFCCIRHMKDLAIISVLGVVASCLVVVVVMNLDFKVERLMREKEEDLTTFVSAERFINGVGVMCFAFAGHTVLPEIVAELRSRDAGKVAVLASIPFVCMWYLLIGISTFWALGCHITSDILEDSEIPVTAGYYVSLAFITLHVLVAFVILTSGGFLFIENKIGIVVEEGSTRFCDKSHLFSVLFRLAMIVVFTAIGLVLPSFGAIMNLLSANTVVLCIMIPMLMFVSLPPPKNTETTCLQACDRRLAWVLLVFGAILSVAVLVSAILSIVHLDKDTEFPLCMYSPSDGADWDLNPRATNPDITSP